MCKPTDIFTVFTLTRSVIPILVNRVPNGRGDACVAPTVIHGIITRGWYKGDGLTLAQVEQALLVGVKIEDYPDTGQGEACLILGICIICPCISSVAGVAMTSQS